ncbi:unnamed protein product [Closterium sp. NIES-54]
MDGHTILLLQTAPQKSSCTYIEYPTTAEAIDGLCALFERRLKEMNPGVKNITYDISELYQFMESLPDLTALVEVQRNEAKGVTNITYDISELYQFMESLPNLTALV